MRMLHFVEIVEMLLVALHFLGAVLLLLLLLLLKLPFCFWILVAHNGFGVVTQGTSAWIRNSAMGNFREISGGAGWLSPPFSFFRRGWLLIGQG